MVTIINLVAGKTREGRVMKILLEKLERTRKELGNDKVFDVIGRLFEGVSIKEYMEKVIVSEGDAEQACRAAGGGSPSGTAGEPPRPAGIRRARLRLPGCGARPGPIEASREGSGRRPPGERRIRPDQGPAEGPHRPPRERPGRPAARARTDRGQ